jgi:tetratricopeptide (TPR) repeat protein
MLRILTGILGLALWTSGALANPTPNAAPKPASPAAAQIPTISIEQALPMCKNSRDANAIPACTGILNMKGLTAPQQSEILHARGLAYAARGQAAPAMTDFNAAVKLTPRNAVLINDRGFLSASLNKLDAAIGDFTTASTLNPSFVDPAYNLGLAYYYKGDMTRAITLYDRVVALRPAAFNALGNRCLAKARVQGQVRAALADCDAALKIQPQHAMNLAIRGLVRLKAGDAAGARADSDAAIKLDPNFGWPYYVRGAIRKMQNDAAGAQQDVARAQALDKTIVTRLAPFALSV